MKSMGPFSGRMFSITIDMTTSSRPSTTRKIKIPFNQLNRWVHSTVCSGIKIKSVKSSSSKQVNGATDQVSSEQMIKARPLHQRDRVVSKQNDTIQIEVDNQDDRRQKTNISKNNNTEQNKKNANDRDNNSKRNQRRSRRKSTKNQ
tara:strand:+ start:6142 stop:6579 length:438 start_codon:yes stop_codon:yes gene_type:complete